MAERERLSDEELAKLAGYYAGALVRELQEARAVIRQVTTFLVDEAQDAEELAQISGLVRVLRALLPEESA